MKPRIYELPDAHLLYFSGFISKPEADVYFIKLLKNLHWKQEKIKLFGKEIWQPRLTALYGTNDKPYTYSGVTMKPEPFTKELTEIKNRIEEVFSSGFTTCLANLYRTGSDSMGWHSDDEKELGKNPVIASASFGSERVFHLRHKHQKNIKEKFILENGSLLIMAGKTQHFWKHSLPKTSKNVAPRINLTYRKIE